MMFLNFIFALIFSIVPQPSNSSTVGVGTSLCQEPSCTITSVSLATAQIWFGVGTTYCATPINISKLPISINDATLNPVLCPSDPAPGATKRIVAQQGTTAYTIGYSINNIAQTPVTIPALVTTLNCTGPLTLPTATTAGSLSLLCK
jgi:hypothetical protein